MQCKRGERWQGGEFISAERVAVWSDDGTAYLYKLPTNCIVESKQFLNRSKTEAGGARTAMLFCELVMDMPQPPLHCPPAFKYLIFSRDGKWMKYLMRGDANGKIALWKIPDTPECASMQLKKVRHTFCYEVQVSLRALKIQLIERAHKKQNNNQHF